MAKSIPLTQGKMALVDDEDFDKLNQYKWCFDGQYAQSKIGNKTTRMHRVIFDSPQVDHVDGDGLNNQRSNLRACNHTQNQMNSVKRKSLSIKLSSKYKGVSWHKQTEKWRARIQTSQGCLYLGLFEVEEDAARAYDEAAKENFGEFARLNFPA